MSYRRQIQPRGCRLAGLLLGRRRSMPDPTGRWARRVSGMHRCAGETSPAPRMGAGVRALKASCISPARRPPGSLGCWGTGRPLMPRAGWCRRRPRRNRVDPDLESTGALPQRLRVEAVDWKRLATSSPDNSWWMHRWWRPASRCRPTGLLGSGWTLTAHSKYPGAGVRQRRGSKSRPTGFGSTSTVSPCGPQRKLQWKGVRCASLGLSWLQKPTLHRCS